MKKHSLIMVCVIFIFFTCMNMKISEDVFQMELNSNANFEKETNKNISIEKILSQVEDFFINITYESGYYAFSITIKKGYIFADYGGSFLRAYVHDISYFNDYILVTIYKDGMYYEIVNGNPVTSWTVPGVYNITIEKQWLLDYLEDSNNNKKSIVIPYSTENGTCKGLVVTDNLRVRSTPNITEKSGIIGLLSKFEDIEVIGSTVYPEEIDGVSRPWYEVKLKDGKTGWVFGGYVIIYATEEEKEIAIKAFSIKDPPVRIEDMDEY